MDVLCRPHIEHRNLTPHTQFYRDSQSKLHLSRQTKQKVSYPILFDSNFNDNPGDSVPPPTDSVPLSPRTYGLDTPVSPEPPLREHANIVPSFFTPSNADSPNSFEHSSTGLHSPEFHMPSSVPSESERSSHSELSTALGTAHTHEGGEPRSRGHVVSPMTLHEALWPNPGGGGMTNSLKRMARENKWKYFVTTSRDDVIDQWTVNISRACISPSSH